CIFRNFISDIKFTSLYRNWHSGPLIFSCFLPTGKHNQYTHQHANKNSTFHHYKIKVLLPDNVVTTATDLPQFGLNRIKRRIESLPTRLCLPIKIHIFIIVSSGGELKTSIRSTKPDSADSIRKNPQIKIDGNTSATFHFSIKMEK